MGVTPLPSRLTSPAAGSGRLLSTSILITISHRRTTGRIRILAAKTFIWPIARPAAMQINRRRLAWAASASSAAVRRPAVCLRPSAPEVPTATRPVAPLSSSPAQCTGRSGGWSVRERCELGVRRAQSSCCPPCCVILAEVTGNRAGHAPRSCVRRPAARVGAARSRIWVAPAWQGTGCCCCCRCWKSGGVLWPLGARLYGRGRSSDWPSHYQTKRLHSIGMNWLHE